MVQKRPSIIPIRWISNGKPITLTNLPQNRPLNVLFMATSPLGVEPVLDFEAEEGKILEATKHTPMDLRVEESGCLSELGYVVREKRGYFDVFHLTGHATHYYKKPCFLTEDEYGNRVNSSTGEIYDALRTSFPPVIFLSGCRTGYSSNSVIPSMAEELCKLGAAVFGWGERVLDNDATAAASQLYWELSQGSSLTEALSYTYLKLIEQQARDWHKLRLYVGNTLPQALVTSLRTKGRKKLPKPTTSLKFRDDDEKQLRVVTREEFVGRRRQLQNCLRTLKTDYEKVGILLHGMGGWGKSSIASRLWDRLPDHEKILWWRQIYESSLIKKLKDKLIKPSQLELIPYLENSQIPLKKRCAHLFKQLAELREEPFLFILDDFEWNLEPREGKYILKPEVAPILAALVEAIQETGTDNKIIITCRYDFDSDLLDDFYKQGLEPFRKAELIKKLIRLEHFKSDTLPENLRERALNLADGNPRLLEFLNKEVLGREDTETKLTELEQSPTEEWKDQIIWSELYELIDEPLQRILSYCLVYELPVPKVAMIAVCDSLDDYQKLLQLGLDFGLIEISSEPREEDRVYRVSRILPHIIPNIQLPEAPEVYSLYCKAHDKLHELWGNKKNKSLEKWREIFRLLFADKDNPERFRQGFSEMLAVQYNREADRAFESELRQLKNELPEENLTSQLENYLSQGDWRKADEETAWLFYVVMVQQDFKDWNELCENFPSEILNEIDQLWVNHSKGKFGFSIQKRIWEGVGENPNADYETWKKFGKQVEWLEEKKGWKEYNSLPFSMESLDGNLPARWITRHWWRGRIIFLASRLNL
ncbi:MAG: GUN4 domain-containing protein [Xenococcaceae cyanobacterium]